MKFSWLNFKIAWLFFFFPFIFFPFGVEISVTVILCLSRRCIWGQIIYVLSFTGSQIEMNCTPGWIIPRASPLPNWDDLDTEIWVLWTDLIYTRFWTLSDPVIRSGFGGTWDGENVFCVWDKHEALGPRVDCGRLNNGSLMIFTSQFPEPVNMLPYMAEGCSMCD